MQRLLIPVAMTVVLFLLPEGARAESEPTRDPSVSAPAPVEMAPVERTKAGKKAAPRRAPQPALSDCSQTFVDTLTVAIGLLARIGDYNAFYFQVNFAVEEYFACINHSG